MHVPDRIALSHLDRMTDSTGLVQHAIYSVPRRQSGYTTDDNARALRLCAALWDLCPDERMLQRASTYLGFLEFARGIGGKFHNFLSYDRHWLDAEGSDDCQGQAVRALAEVVASGLPAGFRTLARDLLETAAPKLSELRSPRALAYIVLAWGRMESAAAEPIEGLEAVACAGARRLAECYCHTLRPDWQWFEPYMTYANAVLPHALLVAARRWPREEFLDIARASFAFLDRATTVEGIFWPVGNEGWHCHGGEKAPYDQQPVEAVTMAEAALAAWQLLGDEECLAAFRRTHNWFHGRNSLRRPLVDVQSGACYDGLRAAGLNLNQGAESTLAYLWTETIYLQECGNGQGSAKK